MAGTGATGEGAAQRDASDLVARFLPLARARVARLGLRPGMAGYDDAQSDALLGVWQAIAAHDPEKGPLPAYVQRRVQWALLDGLRRRGGRGGQRHLADLPLDRAGDLPDTPPPDEAGVSAWELTRQARNVDPRLPRIVRLRAAGYTWAEVGEQLHLSRARVGQLLKQLRDRCAS